MKKAAIYVCIRAEDQGKGFDINSQLEKLRNYCTARDWIIIAGEYVDDGSNRTN